MNRRNFLKNSLALSAGIITGYSGNANALIVEPETVSFKKDALFYEKQNRGERKLWLKREITGEELLLTYKINGQLQNDYKGACHLLRDVKAEKTCRMDEDLLDLLYSMQQFIWENGHTEPFVIKSGYRTKTTNDRTEGAARNSMHLYGMASDIHVDGIPSKYIGSLAELYKAGGVGLYIMKDFVHIDVGGKRKWAI
jgi:uncharacterized protein YcbK (DUF882 family)